jgi:hypothetical protein
MDQGTPEKQDHGDLPRKSKRDEYSPGNDAPLPPERLPGWKGGIVPAAIPTHSQVVMSFHSPLGKEREYRNQAGCSTFAGGTS